MEIPSDLKYTKDHEWVRIEGNIATIGITEYAQEQLGDIVFVDLPGEGEEIQLDEPFGTVESVKSVSDCCAPISGKVLEVNDMLQETPETINADCYTEGWMIRLEIDEDNIPDDLMDKKEYEQYVKELSE